MTVTPDPDQPVNPVADETDPEPGGATRFVDVAPVLPVIEGEAAPGTAPSGNDNVGNPYDALEQDPTPGDRPASVTKDPEMGGE